MQKILFVALGDNLNGTERYIMDIIRNLPKDKYDVYFGIPYKSKLSDIIAENGVKEFDFRNNTLNGFRLRGIYEIFKFILKNNIDIVHSNSGIIPCIIGKIIGVKKCFETRHGLFFTDSYLKNISFLKRLHENIKQYFVKYQIAISENDKKRLMNCFGIKENKIKVIYNGINIDEFKEFKILSDESNKNQQGIIKFLNIGRLTYQKGQDILLEAVNLMKPLSDKFHLTIVGQGENKDKLTEYINSSGLNGLVTIENYKKDIYKYIAGFDCLVMSSRFEGVPYVILESMIIGLPVITTDVGGINNIIDDKVSGLLVNEGDVNGLKDAMTLLINNDELFQRLRKNARDRVSNYQTSKMVEEYCKIYEA